MDKSIAIELPKHHLVLFSPSMPAGILYPGGCSSDGGMQQMVMTATVAEYLEGLDFPATKDEIIQYAEDRNAPPDLLDALENMHEPPDGSYYYSMASVWDALGAIA